MVELVDTTKRFADVTALNALTLSIPDGEIFGLLGPNGAGKTTVLNLLTGYLAADRGSVTVAGLDVRAHTNEVRSLIGLVPQEIAVYPDVSARENIAFFGRLYGLSGGSLRSAVDAALGFVELTGVANRLPKTFSGGMKRRLNIACGIVHAPRLVLMDEPTVGIDPQSREHILAAVERLRASGSTIVYTSHYMEEVERVCSKIAILDHGRVIADGSLRELTALVRDATTVSITLKTPVQLDEADLLRLPGVRSVTITDQRIGVTSDLDAYNIDAIVRTLSDHGAILRGITMDDPSLESVFLALTGRSLRDGRAA